MFLFLYFEYIDWWGFPLDSLNDIALQKADYRKKYRKNEILGCGRY